MAAGNSSLHSNNAAGTPLLDSRSASPNPAFAPDDHFSYSTSLRRQEDSSAGLAVSFALSPGPGGRFGTNGYDGIPGGGGGGNAYRSESRSYPHQQYDHHPFAHTTSPLTPCSHYATQTVSQTLAALFTSPTLGLNSSAIPAIRETHGANEFQVPAKDPLWKRFAGQFYESPLILLLLASAGVSVLVGNYDDAASIVAAIVIVVTGELNSSSPSSDHLDSCR